jgi:hypothetical protein
MPTHYRDPVLTCDGCGATVDRPPSGEGRELHEAGWRFRSNPDERPLRLAPHTCLVSCPNCPRVADY